MAFPDGLVWVDAKVVKVGNSLTLRIPKPLAQVAGAKEGEKVAVTYLVLK